MRNTAPRDRVSIRNPDALSLLKTLILGDIICQIQSSLTLGKLHVLRNEQREFDSVGSGQLPIPGRPTNPSHLAAAQRHIHVGGP